ncbi:hypothetical protein FSP39_014312, partial [Pinctada imbricata]
GGGHKQNYRWVDFVRKQGEDGKSLEERVEKILYDPVRSARLALVASGRQKRYIIATQNVKEGDVVSTSTEIPPVVVSIKEGNAHPLGALPVGAMIHHVEKFPGEGGKYCLAAGASAQLVKKKTDTCIIRLPSKQEVELDRHCIAVIGQVSNSDHQDKHIGSAWRLRWLGFRPRSGLKSRKCGYDGKKIKSSRPAKLVTRIEPEPKVYKMTLDS